LTEPFITSPAGVIAILAATTSLFFWLEKQSGWKFFSYFPPLIFIYLVPIFLSNSGLIPTSSPVYDFMGDSLLPTFLVLMLLDVDVLATIRVMGKGVFVFLAGTVGVMIGAPLAFMLVSHALGPEAWKAYGALAGSWIGGTGNMTAVAASLELNESTLDFGYAMISDNAVYVIWLPIMLASRNVADWFNKFTKIPHDRLEKMKKAAAEMVGDKGRTEMRHYLYLIMLGFGGTAVAIWLAGEIPLPAAGSWMSDIFGVSTYKILIVTAIGIALSFTAAKKIPGSHNFAMALVYLYVARMGAKANLSDLDGSILWFLLGAFVWIFIHGGVLVGAAKVFKVDVHTAAIASAANIGGAASAPIVAAHHSQTLVPVSILMALLGYAIGTPCAIIAATLCKWVG
jgi:uncharacterized membrane protein